ncbi:hypothetical protein L2E82_31047 [Cichorium intybus]|uniref:Uncharacterized protein n=1 Tax=Cichorium intybus TaxID=13427 RepID=A0ACB9D1Y5_CICIN|nr:hypothetical protein L2E82_31047 [Cichorium intybus]
MEVGKLPHGRFSNIVGHTIDHTEVRGWGNTGRPKKLNSSYTELKTVGCIIHGPELEQVYKIPKMPKSLFINKAKEFTSNIYQGRRNGVGSLGMAQGLQFSRAPVLKKISKYTGRPENQKEEQKLVESED